MGGQEGWEKVLMGTSQISPQCACRGSNEGG